MPTESKITSSGNDSQARYQATYKLFRLERYILDETIGPLLAGVFFFEFIFLMFQGIRLAEFFIVHGVSSLILGKMTLLLGISFLPTTLPVAFLIAVLIAFGRLSADSELVALKSCGFSIYRLTAPVFLLSLCVCALTITLNMNWVPWGEQEFKKTLIKVGNTKVSSSIREGTFTSGFFDLLIFVDKVDPVTSELKHIFLYDEREAKNPLVVVAKTGEVLPVKMTSELGAAAMLKLYGGSIHRNTPDENSYQKIEFGEYQLYLKINEAEGDAVLKPHMVTFQELVHRINTTDPHSYDGLEMRGEFWRRLSVGISPLIFVFLGIGFGTIRTRSVRAGAALVAMVILVAYWAIQTWAILAVQKNQFDPLLAMQLPNLVMLPVAIVVFRRASW